MIRNRLTLFMFALLLGATNITNAQTLLFTEDFEDDSNGSDYRANVFDDGGSDVWTRSASSNSGPNTNTEHTYSGYVGSSWWVGEDIDANDNPFGTGNPGYLMMKTIDVSAYQGGTVEVRVYLAGNTGTSNRYEPDDYLQLKYAYDSDIATGANSVGAVPSQANLVTGTYTIFGAFYGSGSGLTATSTALIQDTNLDGLSEGVGGADSLKNVFAEWTFTFPVGATDNNVSILFEGATDAGSEEIGIDNIRVFGVGGSTPVSASITNNNSVSCFGGSDGSLTATASDGTPNYTYAWSNGAITSNTASTTNTINSLSSGTYTVTITDNGGVTATASATILQPTALTATTTGTTDVSCNGGSNGSITVVGGQATPPYTYTWSNGANSSTNGSIGAGTYTVTITDANGCTGVVSESISEPTALVSSAAVTSTLACNGDMNGQVTGSATGGTGSYTYSWNNGGTSPTQTGLGASTYSVTITDNNGCTDSTSVTLTEPAALTAASVADSNVSCNGLSDAGATASPTGGTGPYTYSWNNGATTASITGVIASTYSVTVTDNNGCTDSTSVTLTEPAALTAASVADSNVSCNSFSDAGATASATGGTMPYTYNWNNGAVTASITGVVAGTYSVTLTDVNGCTDSTSVTLTEPATLTAVSVVDSNVSTNGGSDGGATASATGGTGVYTYLWSNSATTASITGVVAGTYTVTVTDANGCTDATSETITQPASISVSAVVDSNVTCNGFSDGGATASASTGTPPYTYNWSNTANTASITGVVAGTYTVTITDNVGTTNTDVVTITEPTALSALSVVDSNVTCNGLLDGGASAAGSGGTPPYTFMWSNSATTASITGVAAGTYTVSVTDNNGCGPSTSSVTVTEPTALSALSVVDSNVSCNGLLDGGASAAGSGGTPPYTFTWSNSATTASITGVAAGTYTVSITDNNGCGPSTSSVTVTEPTALSALSVVDSNVTCNGLLDGGASAAGSGGTPPYTYTWSNSATTASITGVAAGTYTVSITDNNGCGPSTSSVSITEPPALIASSVVDSNVTTNGGTDGGATASATGGAMPYTYTWSNSATTSSITGVVAGTYTVSITDANGCGPSTSSVSITEPSALLASVVIDSNVSCNSFSDGGATASATGGTMPYTYNWSNTAITASITGVVARTYTVTITDNTGTTATASGSITEPALLVAASVTDSNVTCNGLSDGGATASATGGTMPYTYNWSNTATTASITGVIAGTYSVTVTDNNGCTNSTTVTLTEPAVLVAASVADSNVTCNGLSDAGATASATGGTMPYTYNWSNTATTASITGVIAGTYTVTVTDNNGCTNSTTVTLTEPATLVAASIADSNVSCNGLSDAGATASATGGTMPYTYNWSNSATTVSITGVVAGTYSVTITDNNGCTDSTSLTLTEPSVLNAASVVDSNVSINGNADGGATASATGGTMPYTYNWSNSATTASITGVVAGTYTVSVTDANGCGPSTSSVSITEPSALLASLVIDSNVSCNGFSDGGATASATGAIMPYTYQWSNSATTASITGVMAGTYTVTITDNNGATSTASGTITEPAALTVSTTKTDVSCNGEASGTVTVIPSGGTTPYTYLWSTGSSTATNANLTAGTYTATVTDGNGCTTTTSETITEPQAYNISFNVDSMISCNGFSDGGISVMATGGTSPYTYLWSTGSSSASITGIAAGVYTLTITDDNGCDTVLSTTMNEPLAIDISFVVDSNETCSGIDDGGVTATVVNGTTPYTYLWNTGDTTASLTGLSAGTYTLSVVDTIGCSAVDTVEVLDLNGTVTLVNDTGCNVYTWSQNNMMYTMSGLYDDTLQSSIGCDSIIRLDLFMRSNGSIQTVAVCDTFTWGQTGITYSQTGLYYDTLTNAAGCDSVITLDLTIQSNDTNFTVLSCTGFYDWRGDVLIATGIYRDTVQNSLGCDSVLILDLTISRPTESFDTVTTCDQYVWVRDTLSDTLTVSGSYKDTILTTAGCDSIVNLDLTIRNATTAMFSDTACDRYVWVVNSSISRTYTASGTYTEVITNAAGCDSIMTLNLTILNSTSITESESACFSYTWAQTGITYTNSGTYRDTIPNAVGCDSIITLNLLIRTADVTIIRNGFDLIAGANGGGAAFRWIDCGNGDTVITGETSNIYTVARNGFYAVEVTQNGCVDTSACINVVNIGIDENQTENAFSVYPNPTKDNFTIEVSTASKNEVLQLFDLTGSLLKEITISAKKNQIDISDLSEGVYVIRYGKLSKKLVVTK